MVEYGHEQISRIRGAELIAKADRHRLLREARLARAHTSTLDPPGRSFRTSLVTVALTLIIVLGVSAAASARPAKDEPFFERSGTPHGTEVADSGSTSRSEGIDFPEFFAGAGLTLLGLGSGALVWANRRRAKTA